MKKILTVLAICLLLLQFSPVHAEIAVPDLISIGLYYGGSAASSIDFSADKGLEIGCTNGGKYSVLLELVPGESVIARKDAYYTANGNSYTECSAADAGNISGQKLGPYHVLLSGSQTDFQSALAKVQEFKLKDIDAFLSYNDTWQVWTGFYADQAEAEADISGNIKSRLGQGEYQVVKPSAQRVVLNGSDGRVLLLFESAGSILEIRPKAENNPYMLKIKGKNYRGYVQIRRFAGSDMTVINKLPLEEYLYSVVPDEIGGSAPKEALKAQAVAARNFALLYYSQHKHGNWGFDLCNTVDCQVYKGYGSEYPSVTKAIDETKGKKLTYNGSLATTVYFASSGGRTEDVKNVWGSTGYPYLVSVPDTYESGTSSRYNWEITLTAARIKEITGGTIGEIMGMNITKLSEAGRVTGLMVSGTAGQKEYKLESCRTAFGLYSQWYTISTDADISVRSASDTTRIQLPGKLVMTAQGIQAIQAKNSVTVMDASGNRKKISLAPTSYTFKGKGWGHAVGLSQEGAMGMARAGFTYVQILAHYYPGTRLE